MLNISKHSRSYVNYLLYISYSFTSYPISIKKLKTESNYYVIITRFMQRMIKFDRYTTAGLRSIAQQLDQGALQGVVCEGDVLRLPMEGE